MPEEQPVIRMERPTRQPRQQKLTLCLWQGPNKGKAGFADQSRGARNRLAMKPSMPLDATRIRAQPLSNAATSSACSPRISDPSTASSVDGPARRLTCVPVTSTSGISTATATSAAPDDADAVTVSISCCTLAVVTPATRSDRFEMAAESMTAVITNDRPSGVSRVLPAARWGITDRFAGVASACAETAGADAGVPSE